MWMMQQDVYFGKRQPRSIITGQGNQDIILLVLFWINPITAWGSRVSYLQAERSAG